MGLSRSCNYKRPLRKNITWWMPWHFSHRGARTQREFLFGCLSHLGQANRMTWHFLSMNLQNTDIGSVTLVTGKESSKTQPAPK